MSPVLLWCVDIALVIFSVSLVLASWRLLVGPQVLDRVLALDTLYVNALAMLVLLGMRWNTGLFFEAALVIALLGFVGTLALGRFLTRQRLIP
jgi:multicomponent K+:H+ antiporter subunit F